MNLFDTVDIPAHLRAIKELDLTTHCVVELMPKPWFCIGESVKGEQGKTKKVLQRETMLAKTGSFVKSASLFNAVGAVVRNLGRPTAWHSNAKGVPKYRYQPFHSYETAFGGFSAEPVVFIRTLNGDLVINPDLWLLLELTEKKDAVHCWYDEENHIDVIQIVKKADEQKVSIRTDYLQRYLKSRQMELLVSEFRQSIFTPKDEFFDDAFEQGTTVLTNKQKDAKVIVESWGPKKGIGPDYYIRRMQLWSVLAPPAINEDDPFGEVADFDLSKFLLPTSSGFVAPARFLGSQALKHNFEGITCDFMDRVFFSQEALVRYQGLPNHEIGDDGSVRHSHFWSFDRSVSRFGDDYLSIAIGDFAEGVPFREWQHWKHFAVACPDDLWYDREANTQSIVGKVNRLISELHSLNEAFEYFCQIHSPSSATKNLWKEEGNEQLIKELKWFYPEHGNDADFRRRVTQLSTLCFDSLDATTLRKVLDQCGALLDRDTITASRKLLERLCLAAQLMATFRSNSGLKALLELLSDAGTAQEHADVVKEAKVVEKQVWDMFTPLVALYDLRVGLGLAHPKSDSKTTSAAKLLGLPTKEWSRAHYLNLLSRIIAAFDQITTAITKGAQWSLGSHR